MCLGVSLGTIMPLPSGALTIHAAHQLVYELDHARSSGAASVVTDLVCGACVVFRARARYARARSHRYALAALAARRWLLLRLLLRLLLV